MRILSLTRPTTCLCAIAGLMVLATIFFRSSTRSNLHRYQVIPVLWGMSIGKLKFTSENSTLYHITLARTVHNPDSDKNRNKGVIYDTRINEQLPQLSSLPTNDEARYLLYGDKPQSTHLNYTMYEPFLLQHIRAHVSRQTPGQPLRAPRPEETRSGNYNGVERLPGDISMSCQSTVIDKLFNGRRNGFYVEAGALDGVSQSNTWFFETQRNWSGLLIEGNPQLQRSVINVNRNALVLRACVGTVPRPMPARMRLAVGISNLIARGKDQAGPGSADMVCFPFNAIFAALGINHVDFLSLDVEGPELEILSTIDWTRIRIDVIMIEYNTDKEKLRSLRHYFNATGQYKEAGIMVFDNGRPIDVIFQRLDLGTN